MVDYLRTLIRPVSFVALVIVMATGGLLPLTAHAEGNDRPVVEVPADARRPAGTEIPVLWKVRPGVITFYSAQEDPESVTGIYAVFPSDTTNYDGASVTMYEAPVYRMKCGRKHEFTASPFVNLLPEIYKIYIPCAGVSVAIKKVVVKSKSIRVNGMIRPVSKVKKVRVAIYRQGKMVTRAKSPTLKSPWKVAFKKNLRKGVYTVRVRVTAKNGKVKVVKRRIVVR